MEIFIVQFAVYDKQFTSDLFSLLIILITKKLQDIESVHMLAVLFTQKYFVFNLKNSKQTFFSLNIEYHIFVSNFLLVLFDSMKYSVQFYIIYVCYFICI